MNLLEGLLTRRSCRVFLSDPIPVDELRQMVDAGRLAPSARNIQPWEFIVVTEAPARQKLAELADHGKFITDAPACIVVVCRDGDYYLEDGSAAVENILLAAHHFGYGSCWVAGDRKPYAQPVLDFLKVPAGFKLIALLAIGKAGELPPRATKRTLDEVIHMEKF